MKKIIVFCFLIVFGSTGVVKNAYCQNSALTKEANGFNYTQITPDRVNITGELESLTSKEYKSHPEYGILPYNAPCKDCFELLQKRDETHRYFVMAGSKGKEFYQETSYGNENYYDENGVLRSIDPRIKATGESGVFKAGRQPLPVTINIPEKFTSVLNAGKELQVNRDVTIYIKYKDGSIKSLGQPSWSDYTAGDNGVVIHNFYPGIDMELRVQEGAIKSNYRINKPLQLGDGWLVVHDNVLLPDGLSYDYSYAEKHNDGNYTGALCINNEAGTRYFVIGSPGAYDENKENNNAINLPYHTNADGAYDLYVPTEWMNDAERSYPIIIDPFVIATSVLAQVNITGSGYNAQCFKGGCPYNLGVYVPPACTVQDIRYSFNYEGLGTCDLNQGAFDLTLDTLGNCRAPAGTWRVCNIGLPGLCITDSLTCFADVQSCIPAPQCAGYFLPFTLTFYRCVSPGAGCGFSCINAETPWTMYVRGTYITVTARDTTICQGQCDSLTAFPDSGIVGTYTFKWYDQTGLIGTSNPLYVCPIVTTTYTVTAFDCQAQGLDTLTDSAQAICTVRVDTNDIPGFTISINPVCAGIPDTLSAILGVDSNCSWILPGASPNGVFHQKTAIVTYSVAGVYPVIFQWSSPKSTCVYYDTLQVTVNPSIVPSITLQPDTPICQGDNAAFTPDTVNAGSGATYQWFVNSNPVANTFSYSSTALNNGDTVKVVLNSTSALCVSPLDSAFVVMVVNDTLKPAVSITAVPPGIICPGSTVTFTADTTNGNGGANPSFQWQVNGGNVGGNSITYSTNTLQTGNTVTVILTSSVPCPVPPTATSNPIIIQVYPLVSVAAMGDTTICAGQPVNICSAASGGTGGPYVYSWDNGAGNDSCPIVSPVQTTLYTVSAHDSCNANTATDTVNVTVAPAPTPNFIYSPSDISILTPTVYFTDQSANGTPVYWDFGDSTCPNNIGMGTNPSHVYCRPGTYTVKLVEVNASGCLDSIYITLEVNDEYYFYIPNSFTPNDDGINDTFSPQGTDALQSAPLNYTMTIYDRWGEKIFETDNTSFPWTGLANGGTKKAEAGVYVYRIKFTDAHYTDKELVGSVTLVR